MAYTKILSISARMDKRMAYVLNENKTDLNNVLEYAFNPQKNEQHLFECVINCDSKETA